MTREDVLMKLCKTGTDYKMILKIINRNIGTNEGFLIDDLIALSIQQSETIDAQAKQIIALPILIGGGK